MLAVASAQTRNQASNAGAAGVTSRLQSQGYKDIRNLHPGPDGKWVGQATRNGVPVTVTSDRHHDRALTPSLVIVFRRLSRSGRA